MKLRTFAPILFLTAQFAVAQPVITAMAPQSAAAGFAQLTTIQGFGMANNSVALFSPTIGGPSLQCVFILNGPSTENELYIRMTGNGCTIPPGDYLVSVKTDAGTSNAFPYTVKPALVAPIIRSITNTAGVIIGKAAVGQAIRVLGYGMDTTGAKIVFNQGATRIKVQVDNTFSNAQGMACAVLVPAGLVPGTALVQIETQPGSAAAAASFAMKLVIAE